MRTQRRPWRRRGVAVLVLSSFVLLAPTAASQERGSEDEYQGSPPAGLDATQPGTSTDSEAGSSGDAPADVACGFFQGGGSGAGTFRTCISQHANVVSMLTGIPGGGAFEHIAFGAIREGYFYRYDQSEASSDCNYDYGDLENELFDVQAATAASPKAIRTDAFDDFDLEIIVGVNVVNKTQKIIQILKNTDTQDHTNVRLGRVVDVDAEGTSADDVFLTSNHNTMVLGVDSDAAGVTGTGIELFPRSYGAGSKVAATGIQSPDNCIPVGPLASPSAPTDGMLWAWNDFGGTIAQGTTKLVVFQERAL